VLAGVVDRETAANASSNRHDFLVLLERAEKAARFAKQSAPAVAETAEDDAEAEAAEAAPSRTGLRVAGD
jgi:hypothetical protein